MVNWTGLPGGNTVKQLRESERLERFVRFSKRSFCRGGSEKINITTIREDHYMLNWVTKTSKVGKNNVRSWKFSKIFYWKANNLPWSNHSFTYFQKRIIHANSVCRLFYISLIVVLSGQLNNKKLLKMYVYQILAANLNLDLVQFKKYQIWINSNDTRCTFTSFKYFQWL